MAFHCKKTWQGEDVRSLLTSPRPALFYSPAEVVGGRDRACSFLRAHRISIETRHSGAPQMKTIANTARRCCRSVLSDCSCCGWIPGCCSGCCSSHRHERRDVFRLRPTEDLIGHTAFSSSHQEVSRFLWCFLMCIHIVLS